MDFLVISIGVLQMPVYTPILLRLRRRGREARAGRRGCSADALAAARVGGLHKVTTLRKPPGAWKGTPAEDVADLDALTSETTLYQGGADEAAMRYPQNANVAATIAIAGAGFGATEVRLKDPAAGGNIHQVHAEGAFGAVDIETVVNRCRTTPKLQRLLLIP